MMPISRVNDANRWAAEALRYRTTDLEEHRRVEALLSSIEVAYIEPIRSYQFPVIELPETTSLEAVCTIFETLNRTGVKLTAFELISARAFAGGHSLYDMWNEALQQQPLLRDFDVDPMYLLQVIALRRGASCKPRAVLRLSAEVIAAEWASVRDDYAEALRMLRGECGVLIRKWLPYATMLVPMVAVWPEVRAASGPAIATKRHKLQMWFWCSSFGDWYEGAVTTQMERDAPALRDWLNGGEQPEAVSGFSWDGDWRSATQKQKGTYRATIALLLSEQPRDLHSGVPLTPDVLEQYQVDDHHIFPRKYLEETGRAPEKDSVLNHTLIGQTTNIRIGKRAPSEYLKEIRNELGSRLDEVLASRGLPVGPSSPLWRDDFDDFLAWRQDYLDRVLRERTGTTPAGSTDRVDPLVRDLDERIGQLELQLRRAVDAALTKRRR